MRRLLPFLLFTATAAQALDVCPLYGPIHDKEIMTRVKSGIPFKLLSIAADDHASYRRIVRLEYDLWNEVITIENIGSGRTTSTLKDAGAKICKALSLDEAPAGHAYQYRLMLNPVIGEGLQKFRDKSDNKSGLLEINWTRLAKDLETEKTLLENEVKP